jgi:16S rRNA (adenine1518-N6/adenine1519-N6)-dimethyltransferase
MSLYKKTRQLLNEAGIHTKKQLGQNFLVDENIFDFIIQSAEITNSDLVLELGSGLGMLTEKLALSSGKLIAVELDYHLFGLLQDRCRNLDNVILINEDMLKLDFLSLFDDNRTEHISKFKIIGNLPYYITTPILIKILEQYKNVGTALVMMQEEVGQRITAFPGSKDYGSISIAVAYRCISQIIKKIPAESFYPKPKVNSVLVKLEMRDKPSVYVKDEDIFFQIVRSAFQYRRKTLRNALILSYNSGRLKVSIELIDKALRYVEPMIRGEVLSIEQFADLANNIYDYTMEGAK